MVGSRRHELCRQVRECPCHVGMTQGTAWRATRQDRMPSFDLSVVLLLLLLLLRQCHVRLQDVGGWGRLLLLEPPRMGDGCPHTSRGEGCQLRVVVDMGHGHRWQRLLLRHALLRRLGGLGTGHANHGPRSKRLGIRIKLLSFRVEFKTMLLLAIFLLCRRRCSWRT